MKASDFFKQEIDPIVLGAFFSRYVITDDRRYIVTMASFKKSAKISDSDFVFDGYFSRYAKILNEESKLYPNWILRDNVQDNIKLPAGNIFYILENDLSLNEDSFYNKLYIKLLSECPWVYSDKLNEQKKEFIRGFMELRGSIDTQRQYISQDYFFNSQFEAKKAWFLIDHMDIPYYVVNINFRELQKQYYTGENRRNTQLRFEIFWYMQNVGMLNEYKAKIFEVTRELNLPYRSGNVLYYNTNRSMQQSSNLIYDRLNYYSNNVLGQDVANSKVMQLRSRLGFDSPVKGIRSSALVELVRAATPDECMGCKNIYNISDRTFQKDGKYYFEMHHMISLGDNKELDDEDNLVKLCPICHKTLKRGVASEAEQKELIGRIFDNAKNVYDFAEHFFDTTDRDEIIDNTYKNLK